MKSNFGAKVVSISTLIILCTFILFGYLQFEEYHNMTKNFESIKQSVDEGFEMYIETVLVENQKKAEISTGLYTDIINKEILNEYEGNLDELIKDIENPKDDTKLVEIIENNLSDVFINDSSNHNRPIVATQKHIIWNRVISYDYKNFDDNVSWDDFINNHYNPKLSKLAVDAIIDMNSSKNKIIFWEALGNNNPEHKIIDNMDISEIIDVYKKEGLSALKSYEILVPKYITEDGDIFGNKDTDSSGRKVDTNKIIVIQRINVFDALKQHKSELAVYENEIEKINMSYDDMSRNKLSNMITCTILSILTLISSAYIQRKLNG